MGVWALGHTDLAIMAMTVGRMNTTQRYHSLLPMRMEEVPEEIYLWAQDSEKYPQNEGWWYIGVLVSTALKRHLP